MSLQVKRYIIGFVGLTFLASLLLVQSLEIERRKVELGAVAETIVIPASSRACVDCHGQSSPAIIDHWKGSTHARKGVGCVDCHKADKDDVDAFSHWGHTIATVITPRDCAQCHPNESQEFQRSHHAAAGQILASLDNFLAETVEGASEEVDGKRKPILFNPHGGTPGMMVGSVNGASSVIVGCRQCHGSKVGLEATDGGMLTVDDLKPGTDGKPTNIEAVAKIKKNEDGRPSFHFSTWPNTGIGRMNLDGSTGSCSACHSRHDFSPRRARQPENCGKCHLGPDHPQKEIYEESKHGIAYRDLRESMNLDGETWILGKDYSQAPTCATCHMSGHSRNNGKVTHDPGQRISWTNRPPLSQRLDTDSVGKIVTETDDAKRKGLIVETAEEKRNRMKDVCLHCHTTGYVNGFYHQYDEFLLLYNEKFAKPGQELMKVMADEGLLTKQQFDEEIEWTWYFLWHHEGRRARHGASMMAPDYAHWHGMYEVADRFYMELIPQAREIAEQAEKDGKTAAAKKLRDTLQSILDRPEHKWFESQRALKKPENSRAERPPIREHAPDAAAVKPLRDFLLGATASSPSPSPSPAR